MSEAKQRLVETFQETIEVLKSIVAVHERYYETAHFLFVGEKSAEIARRLGMKDEEVFLIRIAGYLHDIGKIGLPDRIIAKPLRGMTDEERNLYYQHPVLGYHILSQHRDFRHVAEIVLHHHERLDGSGFPSRLSGKQIHPGALIIGVVDLYHNAVYKMHRDRTEISKSTAVQYASIQNLLSHTNQRSTQALEYLQRVAGTLFSERVVDEFIAIIEQERRQLGERSVRRIPVAQLRPGMQLLESCYTSSGLLIVGSQEPLTDKSIERLKAFAEAGEIPMKLLVLD